MFRQKPLSSSVDYCAARLTNWRWQVSVETCFTNSKVLPLSLHSKLNSKPVLDEVSW